MSEVRRGDVDTAVTANNTSFYVQSVGCQQSPGMIDSDSRLHVHHDSLVQPWPSSHNDE